MENKIDEQQPRYSKVDTASLTKCLTRDLVDCAGELTAAEKRLNGILANIEKSGIPIGPLKNAIWIYAVCFAKQTCLEMLKSDETEILNFQKKKPTKKEEP